MTEASEPEDDEAIRTRYIAVLAPLFLPEKPTDPDIIQLFASLLRVCGMEDKGWDPYAESRKVIDDLYAMMQIELPEDRFPNRDATIWRIGLLFYNHIIEMDAPYEVMANLLRYRLGKGYSPNPYYDFLTEDQRKRFRKSGLFPKQKIDVIRQLGEEAGLDVAGLIDEFFRTDLRNAIAHSDFIITDEVFRCRRGYGSNAFTISLVELDQLITRAKIFIGTFFGLEREARRVFGELRGQGKAYDPVYKGIMEVLADEEGLMNGFKVHWPNGSDSFYRRTPEGIDMVNCFLDFERKTVELMVGQYAREAGRFSPLVETGAEPRYSSCEGSTVPPTWSP